MKIRVASASRPAVVQERNSPFRRHPGGEEILWEHAGRDATLAFMGTGHTREAVGLLQQYCVGILVEV
ncbi:hypothetical protein HPB48_005544 [Haemaphysalis longicornis]|uniref:Cytochrome b5 heme-binding domain-containing protein n=1 Tax=Haemaphysalis longicornis TaxID=44386 RepID=A0A9J6H0A1_HAELO|nr:hypothetical protein HPB48_005544 [Haemaphysalis longicornis]